MIDPPRQRPTPGREVAAAGAALLGAILGALILGEYEFAGVTPFLAGVLFGLAVAELTLTVARRPTRRLAGVGAAASGAGLAWAAWISSGRGVAPYPTVAYAAIALGVVVSGGWILLPTRRGSGASGPAPGPGPSAPEPSDPA